MGAKKRQAYLEKLSSLDTKNMTLKSIGEELGVSKPHAYIIMMDHNLPYKAGKSGRPKGSLVHHTNLYNAFHRDD